MMTIDLSGQVALVTGGTRGIGLATATALHGAGARVAITGREAGTAATVAASIGEGTLGVGCDVREASQIEAAVRNVEGGLGPVSILVNNAGLTRDNLLLRLTEEEWDDVMHANLRGAFHATRLVMKGMMKRRSGRIINITSVVGLTGNPGQANYAASKAGLIGFTRSVAKEYASRNILANCIAPGFIETDMTAALPDAARAALLDRIPLGRLGRPEDIASMTVFLASEHASYITGQVLVVDGGMVS